MSGICNKIMGGSDRCLCGLMHVKTGTWIIAVVHIVLAIILVVQSVMNFIDVVDAQNSTKTKVIYGIQAALMIIWLILCVFLILGLHKDNAKNIFPHWIVSVIIFVWLCVQVGLDIWQGMEAWNIVVHVLIALVMIYLLAVEYRCYQWMSGSLPV